MANVKNLFRAIVRSGRITGGIYRGRQYSNYEVVEGSLKPQKEYFATFHAVGYIDHDVLVKTSCGELLYFYEL